MAASRRRQGFEAALLVAIALGLPELASGCITIVSLEDKPCPCATGYTCCVSTQTCMTKTQICPSAGSGGAAGSGTTSGSGGVADGGEALGGAGGDQGPPEWRPVGVDQDQLLPTNRVNMAFSLDGTPYVGFRGCDVCAPPAHMPYVQRYTGAWEPLPTTGLPGADLMSPALYVEESGTPYVLIDSGLYAFDGEQWVLLAPPFPYFFSEDAGLWRDEQGTFYTTQFNAETGEVTVVRRQGSTWQTIGSPVLGKSQGATVRVFDGSVYFANAYTTDDLMEWIALRRFDGVDWQTITEFVASGIEFAVASPETIYLSYLELGGRSARMLRSETTGWTDLGMVPAWFYAPKFALTSTGTPYIVYLVEDFINVNVLEGSTWTDVDSRDLGNSSMLPALGLEERDGVVVPYVASAFGDIVRVRKYE